jgi:CHAD domain-containing protein
MSYRLDLEADTPAAVKAVASDQLARASAALRSSDDVWGSIHDARKRLKRFRSLGRSIRRATGSDAVAADMEVAKQVGRSLSAARDLDVAARTLRGVAPEHPLPGPFVDPIRESMAQGRDERGARLLDEGVTLAAAEHVTRAERHVAGWELDGLVVADVVDALARSYRRARAAADRARRKGRADDFHEARKRAKDVRYQAELLRDVWEPAFEGIAEGAVRLTDDLGRVQDLQLVRSILLEGRGDRWNPAGVDLIVVELATALDEARERSLVAAALVYVEKPKDFEHRIHALADAAERSRRHAPRRNRVESAA